MVLGIRIPWDDYQRQGGFWLLALKSPMGSRRKQLRKKPAVTV